MKTFGAILLILVILAAIFFASSWILMLLLNVVITYYGGVAMSYGVALAINAILWMFGGSRYVSKG